MCFAAFQSSESPPPVKSFDRDRYIRIQTGAVGLAEALDAAIGEALAAGARNLFFSGSGGAAVLMQPAAFLLQRRAPKGSAALTQITSNGRRGSR